VIEALGTYGLAFLAGIVSFTSPCCLPLMPGYVSYISGVAGTDGATAVVMRSRATTAALLFVAGFTAVFTALGVGATTLGSLLLRHRVGFMQVGGAFVIVMGLVTMGMLRVPLLFRELRFDLARVRPGPLGAVPLGMAFAIGWTPCVGPVLASILTAAASTDQALGGASLLFVYSLGLGFPFVLLAVGSSRVEPVFRWLRRHGRAVEVAGGSLLVAMGVLMMTGQWLRLFTPLLRTFARTGWPPI
jgi:cytochrome c-type biogenesis protein